MSHLNTVGGRPVVDDNQQQSRVTHGDCSHVDTTGDTSVLGLDHHQEGQGVTHQADPNEYRHTDSLDVPEGRRLQN